METKVIELTETLVRTCRQVLSAIVLDPQTEIIDVSVKRIQTTRFDNPHERTCYILQIRTNDASMVSGAVNSFKGSYKERLEGALQAILESLVPDAEVAVDILGPTGPTVEKLIQYEQLERTKRLRSDSPIAVTAKEFEIPYILVRGRHLVGPNPALARVLAQFSLKHKLARALDLFSGTGIVTKVILREAPRASVTAVERDETKIRAMMRHVTSGGAEIFHGDAFTYPLKGRFDVIVADPYYEDCVSFLKARVGAIRSCAENLVMVGGRIENESWNGKIRGLLEEARFEVQSETLYGQTVFVCS